MAKSQAEFRTMPQTVRHEYECSRPAHIQNQAAKLQAEVVELEHKLYLKEEEEKAKVGWVMIEASDDKFVAAFP